MIALLAAVLAVASPAAVPAAVAAENWAPSVQSFLTLDPQTAPPAVPGAPVASAPVEPLSGRFNSAPRPEFTPGVLCTTSDKDFKEFRYPERIPYCKRNFSTDEKKEVSRWYGVPWEEHSKYQYDHLLSLCLGGSNSLYNLWPMPYEDARAKAKLEFQLCERLKNAELTQAEAVKEELGWFKENRPDLLERFLQASARPAVDRPGAGARPAGSTAAPAAASLARNP